MVCLADKNEQAVQRARELAKQAFEAQKLFADYSQDKVDRIVESMAKAGYEHAARLAKLAVEETGIGRESDKIIKNQFASKNLYESIKDTKTVGVLNRDEARKIVEIAAPAGVIVAIIPTTNPTSTVIFKSMISLKARNSVVISPHPRAIKACVETARIMEEAAVLAGAPKGLIQCLDVASMAAATELMTCEYTSVILATGGSALVKAAYSSGKPAYGVGPGNVPAFIERSADVSTALDRILMSKTFDYGTICASEQAGGVNPDVVGKSPQAIADLAGISIPEGTRVLVADLEGVGKEYPLSAEKLCPVLGFYEVDSWQEACDLCIRLLQFGGLGHSMVIHSNNEQVIMEFAMKKPVFRILCNTPSAQGAIGYTTGLAPSLTLGCGTFGGNITSDNVTARHLMNIKRLAYYNPPAEFSDGGAAKTGYRYTRAQVLAAVERALS